MPSADARRKRRHRFSAERSSAPSPAGRSAATQPPPPASEVQRGVVKWFNGAKGYGFIRCQDGSEVFVHESAVILGSSDLTLAKGREVEFELRLGSRGRQAYSVVVLRDVAMPEEGDAVSASAQATPQAGQARPRQPQAAVQPMPRTDSSPGDTIAAAAAAVAEPEPAVVPAAPREPLVDYSKRMPAAWSRRSNTFVYTYTIYGRRGNQ